MPRPPRHIDAASYYHVPARGSRRDLIFRNQADYERYRALMREIKLREKSSLCHYTLMPNHVHMIIKPNRPSLAGFMKSLQGRYAVYYCKKYHTAGSIWQGHPKALLIDNDAYLVACGNYIEMNPVRAGLVSDPRDWPYSSYRHYAYGEMDDLIDDDPLYSILGKNSDERQRRYRLMIGKTRSAR